MNNEFIKNRMNKNELLKLLDTIKIDKSEFWVLSSGALVLRGLYPDAGDLDIAVTDLGLEQLKRNYNLIDKDNGWYIVSDTIECICDGKREDLIFQPEKVGDYYLQNLNEYLSYLLKSDREKDKNRIKIVQNYLDNIK